MQTYICQQFNCEVCLVPYPLRFRIKEYDKIYELIDYQLSTELDYIVLESLDYIKDKKNLKIIHVVKLINDKISIGKNTSINDIIDKDISVSRRHAVLKYNKKKRYVTIENRSGRIGTLVLIKGNIKAKEEAIGFQVGRSFVSARMIERKIGENISFVKKNDKSDNITQSSSDKND